MNSSNRADQEALDRLVDGEMSSDEQRELLRQLDAEPDGWRRCALAFVEGQSWGRELRGLVRDGQRDSLSSAPSWQQRYLRPLTTALFALAASLLVTSVVLIRPPFTTSTPNERTGSSLVLDQRQRAERPQVMPVVEAGTVDDAWLSTPAPLPDDVARAFRNLGGRVKLERHLMPYQLDDGRQLVVPVDQLDVQPVKARSYQ